MSVTIRPWAESDVRHMAKIMASHRLWQHYRWSYDRAFGSLRRLYEEHESGFVAVNNGRRMMGFILYNDRTFGFSGYIRFLAVDDTAKNHGIGRALILQVEADLLERQVNRVVLLCTVWNDSARRFYEKMGFSMVGKLPDWVLEGTDEVLYAKRLCGR